MADIVIRGMEIPKDRNWKAIRIYPDGTCSVLYWQGAYKILPCTALPLPEGHGRLIDGTELYDVLDGGFDVDLDDLPETKDAILSMIQSTETIVPAEGGTEECSEN